MHKGPHRWSQIKMSSYGVNLEIRKSNRLLYVRDKNMTWYLLKSAFLSSMKWAQWPTASIDEESFPYSKENKWFYLRLYSSTSFLKNTIGNLMVLSDLRLLKYSISITASKALGSEPSSSAESLLICLASLHSLNSQSDKCFFHTFKMVWKTSNRSSFLPFS